MKTILALFAAIALSGCLATAPQAPAAPVYPAWLEMKEGYAEACAAAGKDGCIPMTRAELEQFAALVEQRARMMCNRRT